jgi:nucleotide-binding universal stress UspA family protein
MNANVKPDGGRLVERFKSVLVGVPAVEDAENQPALRLAITLAKAHRAALSLYVFAPPLSSPLPMSTVTASVWIASETERLEEMTSSAIRSASDVIARESVDFAAEHAGPLFEPRSGRFVQQARVHDVTVLDTIDAADTPQRTIIEDVLFDSGRPAFLVPRHGGTAEPQRIAVAWDGSARSARAVKDALPFLVAAEAVVAVSVEGEKDLSRMAPGANLATYLARYAVECKLATLAAPQSDVAARLRLFVAEEDIDMIVMGAFVHSRFRQALLGGVTQSLLEDTPVPLFMAH